MKCSDVLLLGIAVYKDRLIDSQYLIGILLCTIIVTRRMNAQLELNLDNGKIKDI